jgi:hypothetical protein
MTSVYVPLSLDEFELCQPVRQVDFETINLQINGEPRHETWRPIAMQLIHEDEGKNLLPSDSPWFGSDALIFRLAAIDALGAELRKYGELLPVACTEAELLIFNPTRVVDALGEKASSLVRFSSGRIRFCYHCYTSRLRSRTNAAQHPARIQRR